MGRRALYRYRDSRPIDWGELAYGVFVVLMGLAVVAIVFAATIWFCVQVYRDLA